MAAVILRTYRQSGTKHFSPLHSKPQIMFRQSSFKNIIFNASCYLFCFSSKLLILKLNTATVLKRLFYILWHTLGNFWTSSVECLADPRLAFYPQVWRTRYWHSKHCCHAVRVGWLCKNFRIFHALDREFWAIFYSTLLQGGLSSSTVNEENLIASCVA